MALPQARRRRHDRVSALPIRLYGGVLALLLSAWGAAAAPTAAEARLIEGFERIAFGVEIAGTFGGGRYLKRFAGPVGFAIDDRSASGRAREARTFLASLDRRIDGLDSSVLGDPGRANFLVHIVDRKDYQSVGRAIYRNPFMTVPGDCIVRVSFGRRGIVRSDALIVADEGDVLFTRCLIEEVLQGLGPLDDNPDAADSVFNDTSTLTRFSRYDRIMLNMLYDTRLMPGMTAETAGPLLPDIARDTRRRVR
ncbi:MAG: DUF2927 domain-containing protein [Rhizobiaceae bacterium]|nr:DUF2927 domain-containing protein [Rhizobiaceae bacterium]